jgi:LemA protein
MTVVTGIVILLVLAGVVAIWLVSTYNGLVTSRNHYRNAFAQIDVQLKRRYDLIPNLVECVKGYMAHEKSTLEAVMTARSSAFAARERAAANPGDPAAMQQLGLAEGQLVRALGRLIAVAEAYPDLKANTNMLALQEELSSTENKISFARQAFNDAVTAYNNRREAFPTVVVAGMFGFQPAQLLEIESESRQAPRVSFSN